MIALDTGKFGDDGGVQSGTFSSEKIAEARDGLEEEASYSLDSTRRRFEGPSSRIAATWSVRLEYVRLIMGFDEWYTWRGMIRGCGVWFDCNAWETRVGQGLDGKSRLRVIDKLNLIQKIFFPFARLS